jgi:hypothetical protein
LFSQNPEYVIPVGLKYLEVASFMVKDKIPNGWVWDL